MGVGRLARSHSTKAVGSLKRSASALFAKTSSSGVDAGKRAGALTGMASPTVVSAKAGALAKWGEEGGVGREPATISSEPSREGEVERTKAKPGQDLGKAVKDITQVNALLWQDILAMRGHVRMLSAVAEQYAVKVAIQNASLDKLNKRLTELKEEEEEKERSGQTKGGGGGLILCILNLIPRGAFAVARCGRRRV
eukprot:CAMPEP_0172009730 /NCGR_PEP_ID=MMETSP1041-20130122/7350_1 /TAXON_ID=464988 /ORGANISM="Hemiselmis andersenii, Strain CCMP439" /LENGTH=195 /DNA_ID=CAMNT_0012664039 /DNA_START=32 /DNA_END=619 /DNA_ORIENTATION=-